MLNMVIAIMGDSFDWAMENVKKLSIETRLDLLSGLAPSLPQTSSVPPHNYMIILTPVENDEFEEQSWQGSVNKIAFITKK